MPRRPSLPVNDVRRWLPVDSPVTNAVGERSVEAYTAVVRAFDVELNPRYAPKNGVTWCNVFATDVMRAMGVALPHWALPDDTPAEAQDQSRGARELTANDLYDWLMGPPGRRHGWVEVGPRQAQDAANEGKPTVAIWKAPPTQHGHIAVVVPGAWPTGGPWCAQAGAKNFVRAEATRCFGARLPRFYRNS